MNMKDRLKMMEQISIDNQRKLEDWKKDQAPTIHGVLIRPVMGTVQPVTIEHSLTSFYKALECDCIDIVSRRIGGAWFDIVCDDEALCRANPAVSAVSTDRQSGLFGNLFVVKSNGFDDVTSLTDEECRLVLARVGIVVAGDGSPRPVLIGVDYK